METKWPENVGNAASRGYGVRHLQALLMAIMSFMAYCLRVNLSVAIVAMTGMDPSNAGNSSYPVYKWDEETQGLVLSSFFWGYIVTQIPAGILTERFGGHRFLCAAIFVSSALTTVMPYCAFYGGWQLVCANRMAQGLSQGFIYPSVFTLLGLWAPAEERGRMSGVVMGAQVLGTVLAIPLAGFLTASLGWPSVFYCFGIIGMVSAATIVFFGADSPATHRFITSEERNFIENSLGGSKPKTRVPWGQMLTSAPVWAAMITMAVQGGVFMTFLTKIPTYLATVLKFNMEENGLLSALPYLVCWVAISVFSWTCDYLTNRGYLTLTSARKLFNTIAHVGCATAMVLMGYSKSTTMSVFLLTISMGSIGAGYPGVQANYVDIAPNYSGTLYSMGNLLAAGITIIGPIVFGWVVTEPGSAEQWRTMFILTSSVMVLGNFVFVMFGSAETQHWNYGTK